MSIKRERKRPDFYQDLRQKGFNTNIIREALKADWYMSKKYGMFPELMQIIQAQKASDLLGLTLEEFIKKYIR